MQYIMEADYVLESRVTDLTIKTVSEIEELAEEVLTDRATIIDHDKKRNSNREALRALKDTREKQWVCFGNIFIKLPHDQSIKLIQKDQKLLEKEINNYHNGLKVKVQKLHELEGFTDLKGFELNKMT